MYKILNQLLIFNENQIRKLCFEYQKYYNSHRPHAGIAGNIPDQPKVIPLLKNYSSKKKISFKKTQHLDGLITTLEPVAT